jgi:hypothetical protein
MKSGCLLQRVRRSQAPHFSVVHESMRARRRRQSLSVITRQVIDAGLRALEDETEIWKKRARILKDLRARREKQPFEYAGDLIGEARQERENEMNSIKP